MEIPPTPKDFHRIKVKSSDVNIKTSIPKDTKQKMSPAQDETLSMHSVHLPQEGSLNIVVTAKEDTARIIKMIKHQISWHIRRMVVEEMKKASVTLITKRFPNAILHGMGALAFLRENISMHQIIKTMIKRYTSQVNFYARMF